jgi:hypothetical protein
MLCDEAKRLGFVQYHIIQDITIGLGVISL